MDDISSSPFTQNRPQSPSIWTGGLITKLLKKQSFSYAADFVLVYFNFNLALTKRRQKTDKTDVINCQKKLYPTPAEANREVIDDFRG